MTQLRYFDLHRYGRPLVLCRCHSQFRSDTLCALLHIRETVPADALRYSFLLPYPATVVTDREEETSVLET